ncbi:hypothetical protein V7S43_013936 [Phytophthora oleae]|uniref:Anaphase-promoting complex subunit 4 WD40 domain-containing protein n=1 Tax=Phytophthora oleae TaxID=2107226 RepID=A0ABD3F4G7_9STRA
MYRDYGGSYSRYARSSNAQAFSIPDSDFQRGDSTLKRRRQLSPPRPVATSRCAAPAPSDGTITMRARSKSKSRARAPPRRMPGQQFIPLGSNRAGGASTQNTNKASYYNPPEPYAQAPSALATTAARARSRSPHTHQRQPNNALAVANGRRGPSPISTRTRSKSITREIQDTEAAVRRSQRERSKSAARRSGGAPMSSRREPSTTYRSSRTAESSDVRSSRKRERSKSKTREKERGRERERSASRDRRSRRSRAVDVTDEEEKPARASSRSSRRGSSRGRSTTLQEIEKAIADAEKELEPHKQELSEMQDQLAKFQKRVEAKAIEVFDIESELKMLRERRERRLPSHRNDSSCDGKASRRSRSKSKGRARESRRSSSRVRVSKRPRIVDQDDEGSDDDDCVIIDPSEVKRELEKNNETSAKSTVVPNDDSMPDNFWGRSPTPKVLANYRFRAFPDGSARKGRHLAFNPVQPQIFASSPDEGGLILWSYERKRQEIAKVVSLTPTSFRKENPCAESISWSPDGNRMAIAFRDPVEDMGEFCIVQLHQLKLGESDTPQPIPRDRITSNRTVLHPRGIAAIDWLPSGFGAETTSQQLITTGNSDHAVVLWEEHESPRGGLKLKFNVLHRDHKSEVKALCVHSTRDCLYTGGLDGLVIRYDLNKGSRNVLMERRKPISKINSILEHPHNPNLLLVSSIEHSSTQNLLLHDLRQPYDPNGMSLISEGTGVSQYLVPRWSPAGYHVSCGSKTGVVNIWDVRMRSETHPRERPLQHLQLHRKCFPSVWDIGV